MFKIFCFGLFLIGSLIISAFTLNVNLLSKVMAQEYDEYGDSSYSQYPTNDKKYECRTGPFEGFFVSSVEFCKHIKFDKDDRKDKTIEQEHKAQQVHKAPQEHKAQQVQQEVRQVPKVHQDHQACQVPKVKEG